MNTLVNALSGKTKSIRNEKPALTFNGAETLPGSGRASLDLFATIGSLSDAKQVISLFIKAYNEDKVLAGRVSLWSRDCRGGAGRRFAYREILKWLEVNDFEMFQRFLVKTPELGRWDDVLVAQTDAGKQEAFRLVAHGLTQKDALCAKWMPRKGPMALELRAFLGLSPKNYRRLLVGLTNVIETAMCAKTFNEIVYSHVPSVAGARYAKAFRKHDAERYQAWLDSLKAQPKDAKAVKINVDTLFPYDVLRSLAAGQEGYADAAWSALPDYYDRTTMRILSLVDTSASMSNWGYYGQSSTMGKTKTTPMDIAVSLGIYTAERNEGAFKNTAMMFSSSAKFVQFKDGDTLRKKVNRLRNDGYMGSTNIQAAFKLILDTAVTHKVKPEDMPTHLLIISDMEFNQAVVAHDPDFAARRAFQSENFTAMQQMYRSAGYDQPTIVFWNVNSREGNSPVRFDESGTAMVSGFSPAVVKSALNAKVVDPLEVMMETIDKERYSF